jgi:hypothetical protein
VYLDERDRALLDEVTTATGLSKTEAFRQGLRRLADETLRGPRPGSSLAHLIATASDDELPVDASTRHDDFLRDGASSEPKGR